MIPWLDQGEPFPPLDEALGEDSGASGLLAASATVTPERLVEAYRHGIFPWYSEGQPALWWSPDPRMVLRPDEFHVSKTLRKTLKTVLRDSAWEVRVDDDFAAVMRACAKAARDGQAGTWITEAIVKAYGALHRAGLAHSVESWHAGVRVGGLYGVSMGGMFFGESMFAERTDASKIALATLVAQLRRGKVKMIDCQQNTLHLASLGGREMPRERFVAGLREALEATPIDWQFDKTALHDLVNAKGLRA